MIPVNLIIKTRLVRDLIHSSILIVVGLIFLSLSESRRITMNLVTLLYGMSMVIAVSAERSIFPLTSVASICMSVTRLLGRIILYGKSHHISEISA